MYFVGEDRMTRKSACLFCLSLWTLLPGCLKFSPRNFIVDEPTSIIEQPADRPTDIKANPMSRGKNEGAQNTIVKMPEGPPKIMGLMEIMPLDTPPAGERDLNQKCSVANTGVVTIDLAPEFTENKNAHFQVMEPVEKQFSPLALAIHYMQKDQHADAIKTLRVYDEATQEFLLRILPLVTQVAKKSLKELSPQEVGVMRALVVGIDDVLRTRCELLITKMCYARRIDGFAQFEALPNEHAFTAKSDDRPGELVQLYVELKNFASIKTAEDDYLTKLTCSLEVTDSAAKKVWSHTFDRNQTTHRRSARVNDYHGNYSFYVPALAAGTYKLTIQFVDETLPEHRRVARKDLVFRVTPVANSLPPR
jgi:hypothetical protein